MDAWETLLANSILPSGDAWTLLNNPSSTGGSSRSVLVDGLTVKLKSTKVQVGLSSAVQVSIKEPIAFKVKLTTPSISVKLKE